MVQRIVPGGTAARAIAGKTPQELAAQRHEFEEDLQAVKAALLRQLAAGIDLGELVYLAMVEAQREVADGHTLLDDRPGLRGGPRAAVPDGQRAQPTRRGRARFMIANSLRKAVPVGG